MRSFRPALTIESDFAAVEDLLSPDKVLPTAEKDRVEALAAQAEDSIRQWDETEQRLARLILLRLAAQDESSDPLFVPTELVGKLGWVVNALRSLGLVPRDGAVTSLAPSSSADFAGFERSSAGGVTFSRRRPASHHC